MLLYIIRHGDPIYDPDSLTELGHLQAAAVAKRLAHRGIDKIYSSPLIRAQQTAKPTQVLTKKEINIEEWTSESLAYGDFGRTINGKRGWLWRSQKNDLRQSVKEYGDKWFDAPCYEGSNVKKGYFRILEASDEFLLRHGYQHDRENCRYIAKEPNEQRIAVFCHAGFGISWIGTLLDIPLPVAWANFCMDTSCVTVISFDADENGICIPKILTHSNDSHLYKEGFPVKY